MEEEDSGGGDYDTVLKAHARSGGGDYGTVLKAHARSGASDGLLHDCLLMYEMVEAPCAKKYKNVDVVSTISKFSSSLETVGGQLGTGGWTVFSVLKECHSISLCWTRVLEVFLQVELLLFGHCYII
ncbi:hypothetical protein ZEAMMB73_Zm00001d015098 [Zea mays]|nr:hypothetical protein ZEAMMB73_Zm00001d015098 [Zea mays]